MPVVPSMDYDEKYIASRVNYYNQIVQPFVVQNSTPISRYVLTASREAVGKPRDFYANDFLHLLGGLKSRVGSEVCADYLRGDIVDVPPRPSIVRSRPIATNDSATNANSVLLKLETMRHFRFVKDPLSFTQKQSRAVWRGALATNKMRPRLVKKYQNHPLCNFAGVAHRNILDKTYLEISEQLRYQFILSLEGIDVATNLKWIMSSNSLCLSPKLRFETWFMEGRLIPDFHFVLLADDFSNLPEKIAYYAENPDKAQQIIANAHEWVAQFQDPAREDYIGRRVLLKYFQQSGQV